jgi:hypothetical protein
MSEVRTNPSTILAWVGHDAWFNNHILPRWRHWKIAAVRPGRGTLAQNPANSPRTKCESAACGGRFGIIRCGAVKFQHSPKLGVQSFGTSAQHHDEPNLPTERLARESFYKDRASMASYAIPG